MRHDMRLTIPKLKQRLALIEPRVHRRTVDIPPFRYLKLDGPHSKAPLDADANDWPTIQPYDYWGIPQTNFLLRTTFTVPSDWHPSAPIALFLPLGEAWGFSHPEALIYIDGQPLAGCDRHHQEILLPEPYCDGQPHRLDLHGWTGISTRDGENGRLQMRPCQVVQIHQPTRDFVVTACTTLGVIDKLDDAHPVRPHLLNALNDAFINLDTRHVNSEGFYDRVREVYDDLKDVIEGLETAPDIQITAAGHAHIDVAWLWTLDETRRKAGRTFHTVLHLMEQFPEYQFTQSQPQLYAYLQQDYPELFEAIKVKIAEDRWEPIGGMWVEADCNISGAEALARQFLLGRTYFREHFGAEAESTVLWLPDVFGYAWALPQLIKQAGLEYFFTIKIGWNRTNRLPYDSFWWEGIDGSRVLTHFSTTPEAPGTRGTYNANPESWSIIETWENFQQKEDQRHILMSYGWGDGGGGPTREMLENIREMTDFPATPTVKPGKVIDFFRQIDVDAGPRLPVWSGELYLEIHRGTYTTQARNKQANRRSEFLLHDMEFLAAWALLLDDDYSYPAATITEAWKLVCLNQFHDIIPGSSITPVYTESLEQYAQIESMVGLAKATALEAIGLQVGGDVILINPTSFVQRGVVQVTHDLPEGKALATPDGDVLSVERDGDALLVAVEHIEPYSALPLTVVDAVPVTTGLQVGDHFIENDHVRVEVNPQGDISRIYDKVNGREVLPAGAVANQLQAFEDRPLQWDAWDIDIFYDDQMWLSDPAESILPVEGQLRASLVIRRTILDSPYTQTIELDHNSPLIKIHTHIDWRERHTLLKAAFPVDVRSPRATFEIQWGSVERPTHRNTSWDWARFETCAHKWVDLSEGDYGVSLINDCKYGHDIQGNSMRISLLRSPTYPDPTADAGGHTFTYALLPHAGDWTNGTIPAAYGLNDPFIAITTEQAIPEKQPTPQLVCADAENIIIETIKPAEDGNGIIVRLYESLRRRGDFQLKTGFALQSAAVTNLLEEHEADVELVDDHTIALSASPFQIMTLRLIPA